MPPRLQVLRLASSLIKRPHVLPTTPLVAPFLLPAQQRSASILSSLSDRPGAYKKKIRRGRGPASGKGKTAGRGQKGQHAHGKVNAGFEGGQTPLWITNPVRGRNKHNPFKVEYSPINLDRIQDWIDQKRLDPTKPITMKELAKSRCLHGVKKHGVKLLSRNMDKLTSKVHIVVSRASASAIKRVEELGGTVDTRFYSPMSIKRVLRGDSHPVLSLQANAELVARAVSPGDANVLRRALKQPDTPVEVKNEALKAVFDKVNGRYKYRLPDPTSRKDIEYYRDPAHRGYLAYTVKEGESPSLYFKPPRAAKDSKQKAAHKKAAKAVADNRLF